MCKLLFLYTSGLDFRIVVDCAQALVSAIARMCRRVCLMAMAWEVLGGATFCQNILRLLTPNSSPIQKHEEYSSFSAVFLAYLFAL
jgi:hypothetical protein